MKLISISKHKVYCPHTFLINMVALIAYTKVKYIFLFCKQERLLIKELYTHSGFNYIFELFNSLVYTEEYKVDINIHNLLFYLMHCVLWDVKDYKE